MTRDASLPSKVYVEPTTACNLDCRTCVRHSWDEPEGFLEWRAFEAVVDGLAAADEPATLAFMGLGEPLLHPSFLEMVRLAKGAGLRAEVTTNALLLDEPLAAGLLDAGLDQLVVSIDGASAESFGRARSGASLDRVVENVRRLNDARGPGYGPSMRIGVEFVAMRSNIEELPGLGRLAARLGARFIIVTNVLPYTEELAGETLYDVGVMSGDWTETTTMPRWQLPRFGWDERVGAAVGGALRRGGLVSLLDGDAGALARCPFVEADACAVAWHGGVSPCPPLLHTYNCFVRGQAKRARGWQVGSVPAEDLASIWSRPDYAAFRDRVRSFDFPPCTDCSCELAESNEEDCFGNPRPTCGDCLWARGVIRCA